MVFKVPTRREEIGGPRICIVLTMIFHPTSHLLVRVEKRLLLGVGKDCGLCLESSELVGGQIMM